MRLISNRARAPYSLAAGGVGHRCRVTNHVGVGALYKRGKPGSEGRAKLYVEAPPCESVSGLGSGQ